MQAGSETMCCWVSSATYKQSCCPDFPVWAHGLQANHCLKTWRVICLQTIIFDIAQYSVCALKKCAWRTLCWILCHKNVRVQSLKCSVYWSPGHKKINPTILWGFYHCLVFFSNDHLFFVWHQLSLTSAQIFLKCIRLQGSWLLCHGERLTKDLLWWWESVRTYIDIRC